MLKAIEGAAAQRNTKLGLIDNLSIKYIIFGGIGVISIIVINLYLFLAIRRTFRDRKLI